MRRSATLHFLLSALLAAILPWCLCERQALGACAETAEPAAPACCSACPSAPVPGESDTPDGDRCPPYAPCGAGCCLAKGLVDAPTPELPFDEIGAPLPKTLWPEETSGILAEARPAPPTIGRPPGPHAGFATSERCARSLLAAICVLLN